jgi:hypothetical protein
MQANRPPLPGRSPSTIVEELLKWAVVEPPDATGGHITIWAGIVPDSDLGGNRPGNRDDPRPEMNPAQICRAASAAPGTALFKSSSARWTIEVLDLDRPIGGRS